jgi:hypothetical protein
MVDSDFEDSSRQHVFWITGIGAVKSLALLSYTLHRSTAILATQQTPQLAPQLCHGFVIDA